MARITWQNPGGVDFNTSALGHAIDAGRSAAYGMELMRKGLQEREQRIAQERANPFLAELRGHGGNLDKLRAMSPDILQRAIASGASMDQIFDTVDSERQLVSDLRTAGLNQKYRGKELSWFDRLKEDQLANSRASRAASYASVANSRDAVETRRQERLFEDQQRAGLAAAQQALLDTVRAGGTLEEGATAFKQSLGEGGFSVDAVATNQALENLLGTLDMVTPAQAAGLEAAAKELERQHELEKVRIQHNKPQSLDTPPTDDRNIIGRIALENLWGSMTNAQKMEQNQFLASSAGLGRQEWGQLVAAFGDDLDGLHEYLVNLQGSTGGF